jgi:excisionase family DNA binding protein
MRRPFRRLTPDDILTPAEAAALLRCAKKTLYDWVSEGRVPYIKDGRRLLFSRSELLQYLGRKPGLTLEDVDGLRVV